MKNNKCLHCQDPEVHRIIESEKIRQTEGIELIPSENYVSKAVLKAVGSIMTNKYSEGYPGKRYYGGQEFVDQMESLAIERAKKLFSAEHINVQPYSGSPANTAVYFALLEYGDTVMGMKLDHGGHITHGLPISFSGKSYNFVSYGVNEKTQLIDMEEVRLAALKCKPKMIIAGFSAYPRNLDWEGFRKIADEVGAILMGDIAHIAGLIAGGVIPNPIPILDVATTTTHKTLRGPRGAMIMCKQKYAKAIDRAIFPGLQGGPHDNVNAAKAVSFLEALQPEFKDYCKQIIKNSKKLAQRLIEHGFNLVSGGTDNHLILVDLRNKKIGGKEAEEVLDKVGITLNKNTVPYDPNPPFTPSGIRLGTPAVTTRGMKEDEMILIADFMNEAINSINNEPKLAEIKLRVTNMCKLFPVPGIETTDEKC